MLKKKILSMIIVTVLLVSQAISVSAIEEQKPHSYFGKFSGVVQEINPHGVDESMELVLVENEEGALANFLVSKGTYIIGEDILGIGQEVTGYYVADAPMIMIYPPQYPTKVLVIGDEEEQIKIDRFNEDLVSDDQMLKLNDLSQTQILDEEGKVYDKTLENRQLIVFYDVSTRSIPAQTNPKKIIVLDWELPIREMDIVVDGAIIEGPQAFENSEGAIMVPLRAIAEALGYEVGWDNDSKTVYVGNVSSFQIGVNQYSFGKMTPVELNTEPIIVNDHSFIPLNYFTDVLQVQQAYVSEYEILIKAR